MQHERKAIVMRPKIEFPTEWTMPVPTENDDNAEDEQPLGDPKLDATKPQPKEIWLVPQA